MFREFLQNQAQSTFNKKELRNLMRDAGDILADQEMYEDAADLFILAQDWEEKHRCTSPYLPIRK